MSSNDPSPSPRIKRTPDERFQNLKDYTFTPNYLDVSAYGIDNNRVTTLRMHYIDEWKGDGDKGRYGRETVLLLHGEPTWSYLYRYFIPPLVQKGYRVVVPDMIGFGKSDKPTEKSDYTIDRHKQWIRDLIEKLDLQHITLFGQDWGSIIGLALVGTADVTYRFDRVFMANGFLATDTAKPTDGFYKWQGYARKQKSMDMGMIVQGAIRRKLSKEEKDAYNAPYPDASYQAAALVFPALMPTPKTPYPGKQWFFDVEVLQRFDRPFLTVFGADDPNTRGAEKAMQQLIPGCKNLKGVQHRILEHAGHFIQEDAAEELVKNLIALIENNPVNDDNIKSKL